jgi:hypothetical protein
MTACRYDRDAEDYLRDGEPCRHDDYGDPTKHCTARRTCANHVGRDELTCARCITRARNDLRRIPQLAALMLPVALGAGVNSEAANMAGPAADYGVFSARRLLDKRWIERHIPARHAERAMRNLLADDDEDHPYSVLTRWQTMLAEDYRHPLPERLNVTNAAEYLDRQLHRIAQDDEQDFPLLARELRRCRSHLETTMADSRAKERGAPCPECKADGALVRLVRDYGHWCDDEDCERIHYADDSGDEWVCPRNRREHKWTHEDYERWIEPRHDGQRSAV